MSILLMTAQQATTVYLALYFTEVVLPRSIPEEGARIVAAGGLVALFHAGGGVGRISWGVVSDRCFRHRRVAVIAIIGALATVIEVAMARLDAAETAWLPAALSLAAGATLMGWNGVYHTVVSETAGRKHAATGLGFCLTFLEMGTTVGPPLFGVVVDLAGSYQVAWHFLALIAAAGTGVALFAARTVVPSPDRTL